MATQDDVRRIALSLPATTEDTESFGFSVRKGAKQKGFCWVWLERVEPKQPRVPRPDGLGIRVADEDEKHALIASEPKKFFTEPHYDGQPVVLVRLPAVGEEELREPLTDAWRIQAPTSLARKHTS